VRARNQNNRPNRPDKETLSFGTYSSGCRLGVSGQQQRVLPDGGGRELPGGDPEQLDPAVLVRVRDGPVEVLHVLPKQRKAKHGRHSLLTVRRTTQHRTRWFRS
jgi:hypothetical protein